ncbi:hypothetical protein [Streptomyces sp. CBMA123]|uniref:hypothetical protein n=1 Tax=Streptomyces sp. CBMA123 TaxID=1896313 RepID=UPI001661AE42|nr:hypothetical protein [Streptomyces sp. CBMA123]
MPDLSDEAANDNDSAMDLDRLWERVRDKHAQLKGYSDDAPDFMNLLLLYLQQDMGDAALNMLKLRKMRVGRKGHATKELRAALVSVAQMALVALLESAEEEAPEVFRSELRL